MKHIVGRPAWACMLLAAALLGGQLAQAAPAEDDGHSAAVKKTKKVKRGHGGQVKFLPGSEETAKQRSSRLQRECKGRVNAGACAGYTY